MSTLPGCQGFHPVTLPFTSANLDGGKKCIQYLHIHREGKSTHGGGVHVLMLHLLYRVVDVHLANDFILDSFLECSSCVGLSFNIYVSG